MKKLIAIVFIPMLLLGCAEKPQPEPAPQPRRSVETESRPSVPVGWEGIRPSGVHPQMVYSNGIFVVLKPTRPCPDCTRPLPVDFTNRCPWCSTPQRPQERIPLELTELNQRADIHPQYFETRGPISVADPPVVVGPRRYCLDCQRYTPSNHPNKYCMFCVAPPVYDKEKESEHPN